MRLQRLMAFIDPWASPKEEGFQLIQSLYALGSGGLFGVGLGESKQKYLYLPEGYVDKYVEGVGVVLPTPTKEDYDQSHINEIISGRILVITNKNQLR